MPRLRHTHTRPVAVAAARLGVAVALVAVSCVGPSPATELLAQLDEAPPLRSFEVRVSSSAPNLFECFAPNGAFTINVAAPDGPIVLSEPGPRDPALVVDGDTVTLRPSAFSSGPDEWWTPKPGTPRAAIERVVGPVVTSAVFDRTLTDPADQLRPTVIEADKVTGSDDSFRIVERGGDAAVLDVRLDDHGHPQQVRVAAEASDRPGEPDPTQPRYLAEYRHTRPPPDIDLSGARIVTAAQLDRLDVALGACGVQLDP